MLTQNYTLFTLEKLIRHHDRPKRFVTRLRSREPALKDSETHISQEVRVSPKHYHN